MDKVSKLITGSTWRKIFEHPMIAKHIVIAYQRVKPSPETDLAYEVGRQAGRQETFEFLISALPKIVNRDEEEKARRDSASPADVSTSGLPAD